MSERFWFVGGKQVQVSNQVHNALKHGKERTYKLENEWKERIEFSLNEDLSEQKLYNNSREMSSSMEHEVELQVIMKEAFQQLTEWERHLIYRLFYEEVSMADFAREENMYHTTVRREKEKALLHLRQILKEMGINQEEDLY